MFPSDGIKLCGYVKRSHTFCRRCIDKIYTWTYISLIFSCKNNWCHKKWNWKTETININSIKINKFWDFSKLISIICNQTTNSKLCTKHRERCCTVKQHEILWISDDKLRNTINRWFKALQYKPLENRGKDQTFKKWHWGSTDEYKVR